MAYDSTMRYSRLGPELESAEAAIFGPRREPTYPSRFSPARSDRSAPPASASETDMDVESANWQANLELAERDDEEAKFAMLDLPRMMSEVKFWAGRQDYAKTKAVVDDIASFVADHRDGLSEWTAVKHNGPRGKAMSERLTSAMDESYLDVITVRIGSDNVPLRAVLFGNDPDVKEHVRAVDAARAAREFNVDADVARGMVDEDSDLYRLFGRYGRELAAKAQTTGSPVGDMALAAERAKTETRLHDAAVLHRKLGAAFGSVADEADFMEAYHRIFGGRDSADPGFITTAAEGWLAQRSAGVSTAQYLDELNTLTNGLTRAAAGSDKAPANRAAALSDFQANAYAKELLDIAHTSGLGDVMSNPLVAGELSAAASDVRDLRDQFGVALFDGRSGVARAAARTALARAGYAGFADELADMRAGAGMLARAFMEGSAAAGMKTVVDEKGEVGVQSGAVKSPFYETDRAAMVAAGKAVWALRDGVFDESTQTSTAPESSSWAGLVEFVRTNGAARSKVVSAVADALKYRFQGDRALAEEVAREKVAGLWGAPVGTEDALRRIWRPSAPAAAGGAPQAPVFNPESVNLNRPEVLGALVRDPSSVVPLAKDGKGRVTGKDRGLESALRGYGKSAQKTVIKSSGDYQFEKSAAFGRVVKEAVDGLDSSVQTALSDGVVGEWLRGRADPRNYTHERSLAARISGLVDEARAGSVDAAVLLMVGLANGWDFSDPETVRLSGPEESTSSIYARIANAIAKVGASGMQGHGPVPSHLPGPSVSAQLAGLGLASVSLPAGASDEERQNYVKMQLPNLDLSKSLLIREGAVKIGDNGVPVVDEQGFLAKLAMDRQQAPAVAPAALAGPNADAAGRVLSSYGSGERDVALALEKYTQHLVSQGYRGRALLSMQAAAGAEFSAFHREGGSNALQAHLDNKLLRRRYFFPKFNEAGVMYENSVDPSRDCMTKGEYDAACAEINRLRAAAGRPPVSPDAFFRANALGMSYVADEVAKAEKLASYATRERIKKSMGSDDESAGK